MQYISNFEIMGSSYSRLENVLHMRLTMIGCYDTYMLTIYFNFCLYDFGSVRYRTVHLLEHPIHPLSVRYIIEYQASDSSFFIIFILASINHHRGAKTSRMNPFSFLSFV